MKSAYPSFKSNDKKMFRKCATYIEEFLHHNSYIDSEYNDIDYNIDNFDQIYNLFENNKKSTVELPYDLNLYNIQILGYNCYFDDAYDCNYNYLFKLYNQFNIIYVRVYRILPYENDDICEIDMYECHKSIYDFKICLTDLYFDCRYCLKDNKVDAFYIQNNIIFQNLTLRNFICKECKKYIIYDGYMFYIPTDIKIIIYSYYFKHILYH